MSKRRWFHRFLRLQFGLRTMLIAVVIVAVWCAWYLQPQRRERRVAGNMLLYEQFRHVYTDGNFEREEKHGRWELRDEQRRLHVRGHYREDEPNGRWTYYYPSGRKSAAGMARHGGPTGLWKTWHASGRRRSESTFAQITLTGFEEQAPRGYHTRQIGRDGKETVDVISFPQGTVRMWHANGQPACVGQYQDGERSGIWTYFDEQGRKNAEGHYRHDRREGRWTFWEPPDQQPRLVEYASGRIVDDLPVALASCESDLMTGELRQKLHAVRRLEQFGPRGVELLGRAARHEDRRVRLLAAQTLGNLGEDAAAAVEVLESLALDEDRDIRHHALLALARVDRPRRTAWLRMLLAEVVATDSDEAARSALVTRVSGLGQTTVPLTGRVARRRRHSDPPAGIGRSRSRSTVSYLRGAAKAVGEGKTRSGGASPSACRGDPDFQVSTSAGINLKECDRQPAV